MLLTKMISKLTLIAIWAQDRQLVGAWPTWAFSRAARARLFFDLDTTSKYIRAGCSRLTNDSQLEEFIRDASAGKERLLPSHFSLRHYATDTCRSYRVFADACGCMHASKDADVCMRVHVGECRPASARPESMSFFSSTPPPSPPLHQGPAASIGSYLSRR